MSVTEPHRGDYAHDPGPAHGTRYACPVDDCDWYLDEAPVDERLGMGTLADVFGFGVIAAHALNERARTVEAELNAHLDSHTVLEWVRTVERLRTAAGEKR